MMHARAQERYRTSTERRTGANFVSTVDCTFHSSSVLVPILCACKYTQYLAKCIMQIIMEFASKQSQYNKILIAMRK